MYKLLAKQPNSDIWVQLETLTTDLPINKQRNDIAELKDRQGDYSQAISLPMVQKNCDFFEYINGFTTVSSLRRKKYDCRLFYNGVEIASKGSWLKIVRISEYFEVQILGSESLFMSQLADKKLNDLDLNEIIIGGKVGIESSEYKVLNDLNVFYGACDFASEDKATYSLGYSTISNLYQFPFVRLKYIIEKIIFENGNYFLESDITLDDEYLLALIPFENRLPTQLKLIGNNSCESVKQDPVLTYKWFDSQSMVDYFSFMFDVKENQSQEANGIVYVNNKNTNFLINPVQSGDGFLFKIIPTSNTLNFTVDFIFRAEKNITNTIIKFYCDDDLSEYYPIDVISLNVMDEDGTYTYFNQSVSINHTFVGDPSAMRFKARILLSFTTDEDTYIEPFFFQIKDNDLVNQTTYEVPVVDDYFMSLDLMPKKNMKDISQADFFKSFMQMFGLTIDINEADKIIRAYTFKYVIDNKIIAKDFTYKLQYTKNEAFQLGEYAKQNIISYTPKEDVITGQGQDYRQISQDQAFEMYNNGYDLIYYDSNIEMIHFNKSLSTFPIKPTYYCYTNDLKDSKNTYRSEGLLTIDDDTLKNTINLFDLPFEACEMIKRFYNIPTPHIWNIAKIKWYTKTGSYSTSSKIALFTRNMNRFQIINPDDKIMGENWLPKISPIYTPIGANTISIEAYDLVKKYYKYYQSKVLNNIRFIEDAEFFLDAINIQEYDPFVPIYLQQYSSYFYINKIKNFIAGKLTKVDLIKI